MDQEKLLVIGNGPGDLPMDVGKWPRVTFNAVNNTLAEPNEIRVMNSKTAGRLGPDLQFLVSSEHFSRKWCRQFQAQLLLTAMELKAELNCVPSTGLVSLRVLSGMKMPLCIYRMTLCPSLMRQPEMSQRKPLPAAFHNWLGERRLALQLWQNAADSLYWPQLHFPLENNAENESGCGDPASELLQWFTSSEGQPESGNTDELNRLSELPLASWLLSADDQKLRELECFFFLSRYKRATPNWWLYRNNLSSVINDLQLRLMQVQQYLSNLPLAN